MPARKKRPDKHGVLSLADLSTNDIRLCKQLMLVERGTPYGSHYVEGNTADQVSMRRLIKAGLIIEDPGTRHNVKATHQFRVLMIKGPPWFLK
jgi:hypothetical protein